MLVGSRGADDVISLDEAVPPPAPARLLALAEAESPAQGTALDATCDALTICLREGDLFAAERVLALLAQHVPDRATLFSDVLQPCLRAELVGLRDSPETVTTFVATARDLLLTQRRPT